MMVGVSRFEALYRDHFPFVWAAARRCGAPAEVVEDVVQDVFVTAYRRLDDLHWEVSPRGWLYGVTRRIAFRYRRSATRTDRRRRAMASRPDSQEEPHRRHDAALQLETWLERVDTAQREVWEMTELLGMSGPEIAAELQIPLNTVYSRLRLVRHRLEQLARSSQAIDTSVADARDEQRPAPQQAARSWAAIVPVLGSPWPLVGAKALAIAEGAWLPVAVAAFVVGLVVARPANDDADTLAREEERVPARAAEQAPAQGEAKTTQPASIDPGPAPILATSESAPTPERAATKSPAAVASAAIDAALAAELALLERAHRRLDAADPNGALAVLAEHAQRFPSGQLVEARRAAEVRTLCALGRVAEAEQEAAALHRDHPGSNIARAVADTCAPRDGSAAPRRTSR
jgi:RNA polymerase sigma factor (sigma-70 family)